MCGRIRKGPVIYVPGNSLQINTKSGINTMNWGNKFGDYYNARSENLYSTWQGIQSNRCILEVDSFNEKDRSFIDLSNKTLKLAGIFNKEYFMLLTQQADYLVSKFHHRMPVIINNMEDYFLNEKVINFNLFNYSLKIA